MMVWFYCSGSKVRMSITVGNMSWSKAVTSWWTWGREMGSLRTSPGDLPLGRPHLWIFLQIMPMMASPEVPSSLKPSLSSHDPIILKIHLWMLLYWVPSLQFLTHFGHASDPILNTRVAHSRPSSFHPSIHLPSYLSLHLENILKYLWSFFWDSGIVIHTDKNREKLGLQMCLVAENICCSCYPHCGS